MRLPLIVPAAFTLVLAAQPAPHSLVNTFNSELPGINKLLAELKFQEAADKAKSLLPAQAPAFEAKDVPSIGKSFDDARGYLALLKLQATTAVATGQWEQAAEINQKRVEFAQGFAKQVDAAMTGLEAPWVKVVAEGKAFAAEKTPRANELEKSLAKLQEDIKNHNEKKVVLDKKQLEEIQKVRIPQAQKDEAELNEIKGRLAGFQDATKKYPMFQNMVAENRKDAGSMQKEAEEALAKSKGVVASQAEEIKTFNAQQLEKNKKNKKFKIEGNKNWVEAVMNDKTNITKLEGARAQAQFLSRMLVLEPGNKPAAAALKNLQEGKDAFAVEKKGAKKAGKK